MKENILHFIENLTVYKELTVFIISMLPIFELRGAIPVAVLQFKIPLLKAFLISITGNMVPVLPLILFLNPIRRLVSKISFMERFFNWIYERAYKKSKNVMKYGAIGLALFVAIPLPVTGAWTGAIAAIVFDIKPKYAFPAIFLGVCLAGIIVSSLVHFGYMIAH